MHDGPMSGGQASAGRPDRGGITEVRIPEARVDLDGIIVDLMSEDRAIARIAGRATARGGGNGRGVRDTRGSHDARDDAARPAPLAVVSANLDHIVQFGASGRWRNTLGDSLRPTFSHAAGAPERLDWLTLVDGAPLVARAEALTGRRWPRLAGSDLAEPVLDAAEHAGLTVGFLGGSFVVQRMLSRVLLTSRPGLEIAGMWSPDRSELADPVASRRLAESVAASGVDLLVVGLGKPRQELWIAEYGPSTGAHVLLAFGAVVDFLAEAIPRAPRLAADNGLEWAWRLLREPRRLARRYLLDDPPGLLRMQRHSALVDPAEAVDPARDLGQADAFAEVLKPAEAPSGGFGQSGSEARASVFGPVDVPAPAAAPDQTPAPGAFTPPGLPADIAVLCVTYNSADHIGGLIESLRAATIPAHTEAELPGAPPEPSPAPPPGAETTSLRIRVVVADNDSADATLAVLADHPDVITVRTPGNLGYAAGLNIAARHAGDARTLLIANPDLRFEPGALHALLRTIDAGTADAAVPRIVDESGRLQRSVFREPSLTTVAGDALFGGHWPNRPGWLAESDAAAETYQFAHEIDWATGAALLIRTNLAKEVGPWDERFFLYSEETDYFRRIREAGGRTVLEPAATAVHAGAGSGTSDRQAALMSVNRIRYFRKHHSRPAAAAFHAGVIAHEALRWVVAGRRGVLGIVADEARWDELPGPRPAGAASAGPRPAEPAPADDFPEGTVIIPAHDEAAVIEHTLRTLAPVTRTGRVDVIVVCNGCTDDTAERAKAYPGVRVIDLPEASKTAALNAGDAAAHRWPRVYMDADTAIAPATLRLLLERLTDGTVLAARPQCVTTSDRATWPVRAYYRARRRMDSLNGSLWGAGVYGLTEEGHARFGLFPDVTADDAFVDLLFAEKEKVVVPGPPVQFHTPRDARSLTTVLRRHERGPRELRARAAGPTGSTSTAGPAGAAEHQAGETAPPLGSSTAARTARDLVLTVRGPGSAFDALSYAGFAALPRIERVRGTVQDRIADAREGAPRIARRTAPAWERDMSTRGGLADRNTRGEVADRTTRGGLADRSTRTADRAYRSH